MIETIIFFNKFGTERKKNDFRLDANFIAFSSSSVNNIRVEVGCTGGLIKRKDN